ncbi:MAG: ATP-binding protein [Elusimicrobiales bacterium]
MMRKNRLSSAVMDALMHDIKNPLASVILAVTSSQSRPGLPPDLGGMLGMAYSSALLVQRLVDCAQRACALEDGRLAPERRAVELRPLLERAAGEAAPLCGSSRARAEIEISPRLPHEICADPDMLRNVIVNLLLDAARYSPNCAGVRLSAFANGGRAVFCVSDSGPRCPPALLKSYFAKHPPSALRRLRRGAGLNRRYCLLAVKAHGGSIRAENSAGGMAVRVEIPL